MVDHDASPTRLRHPPPAQPRRGYRSAAVLVAATFAVNAMDRQIFPVLLPTIRTAFGFTSGAAGLLSTIFTLGLGVAGIAAGSVLVRFGRKNVLLLGVATFSVATFLQAMASGFGSMATYRVLSGVGEGIQYAALLAIIGGYFGRRRGIAIGGVNVAYGIGAFVSPLIGTRLATATNTWRTPFVVYAALGLLFGLLVIGIPRWFTEAAHEDDSVIDVVESPRMPNRNAVACAVACLVPGFCGYAYLGLYPTYMGTALHFTSGQVGLISGVYAIGSLLGIPVGWFIDRWNLRWLLIAAAIGSAVDGALLFNVDGGPLAQAALSVLEGVFISGITVTTLQTLLQRSLPAHRIGTASGLYTLCVYLPAAVSGYVFSSLQHALGWGGAALVQLSVPPLAAAIAILTLQPRVLRPGPTA